MSHWTLRPVGFIQSPYTEASQIPKGPGAEHRAECVLEILPEFEEGLLDIEGFSHLFLIWVFDRSEGFQLTGIPPTDDRPHGVFATRSPYRPNALGLTVVTLLQREKNKLYLRGIDMLDGTPVLDIKPLLSSIPQDQLKRGWLEEAEARRKPESASQRRNFAVSKKRILSGITGKPVKYCLECLVFFPPTSPEVDRHASHYTWLLPRAKEDFDFWLERIRRKDKQVWGVMLDEDGVESKPFCPTDYFIEVVD